MDLTYHVEIARKPTSKLRRVELEELIKSKIESLTKPCSFDLEEDCHASIKEYVDSIRISTERTDGNIEEYDPNSEYVHWNGNSYRVATPEQMEVTRRIDEQRAEDPKIQRKLQRVMEATRATKALAFEALELRDDDELGAISLLTGDGKGMPDFDDLQDEPAMPNGITLSKKKKRVSEIKRTFVYHSFELNEDLDEAEFVDDGDAEEGQLPSSHHWILPSKAFDGLWESLVFDADIKTRLMEYIKTTLLFSEKGVNSSLIAWNKVILLHGPPGTGKTSLCKALAQKATVYLGKQFRYGQLVEINSHSLFSKWFSESGKLVMKMFEKVQELIEDSKSIVFLLIDEVESLAQSRSSAEAGNEPSDSIRAVNALLTQIDRIKRYPNVVILTTSNIVGSIDLAFVDRADLKIYIGFPPTKIVYEIFASSINELMRVGIIATPVNGYLPLEINTAQRSHYVNAVLRLAISSEGMSGRGLRKIPFLAHVNFIRSHNCSLDCFLRAMSKSIIIEKGEAKALTNKTDLTDCDSDL